MLSEIGEASFLLNTENMEIIMAVMATAVVVLGWLFNSWQQRTLQRKQLAVNILSQNRFQEKWVNSLANVFKIIRNDKDFNWVEIAEKCFDDRHEITDEQQKIYEDIKCVLNNLEFISIAVLNKAIDESIIRWSYDYYYATLSNVLADHIKTTRKLLKDEEVYINFTTLAEQWRKKPAAAKPGSGWR